MEIDKFSPAKQRQALVEFLVAINGRRKALRQDEHGEWVIYGKRGHIDAVPEGFQLCYFARYVFTEPGGYGPLLPDYAAAKRKLAFCKLAQDGTGEGIFFLDRLPDDAEAGAIRDVFKIFRVPNISEEARDARREAARVRFGHSSPGESIG